MLVNGESLKMFWSGLNCATTYTYDVCMIFQVKKVAVCRN